MRGLIRNSIIYGFGNILSRFIGIFILPLFTNLIDPVDYGIYSLILMSNLIATNFFNLGQTASVGTVYYRNCKSSSGDAMWGSVLITVIGAISLALLAILFPVELCRLLQVPLSHSNILTISLLSVSINLIGGIFLQYLQLEEKVKVYVVLTTISAVMTVALSLIFVIYQEKGIFGLVLSSICSGLFLLITSSFFLFINKKISLNYSITKELFLTGFSLIPSNIIWFVLVNQSRYFLESYHGLGAVGIYSVGYSIGNSLSILTSGIASAWYPFFMKYIDKQSEAKVLFSRITYYYIIIVGALTLWLFAISRSISLILLDIRYLSAYKVIGFVGSASFFSGLFNLLLPGVYYSNKVRKLFLIQLVAVLLGIPIAFFGTLYFGLLGAAVSLSVSHLLLPFCLYIWLAFNEKINFKLSYDIKKLLIYFSCFFCIQYLFLNFASEQLMASIINSVVGTLFILLFSIQFILESDIDSVGFIKKFKIKFP